MQLLLNEQFAPITSTILFFEAETKQVVDTFIEWQSPLQSKRGVSLTSKLVQGKLDGVLRSLLPLTSVEARRFLFVPTQGAWTAMFDSGHRGTDPSTYISHLMKCRAVRATAVPHTLKRDAPNAKGRWGATIFSLFGPGGEGPFNDIRSVCAANDGGRWGFTSTGAKQSFEEEAKYSLPRIGDRFTPEMLERYLKALGIDAFRESYYLTQTGATLVQKHGPVAKNLREFSLEEVQERF